MAKVQQITPRNVDGQPEKTPTKGALSKIAAKAFFWRKPKTVELPKTSEFTVYCRTSAFQDAATKDILSNWYEAYEGKDGYWTILKKTKMIDVEAPEEARFKYKGTVVSTQIRFDQVLKELHAFEQGAKALGCVMSLPNTEHFYQEAGAVEGFIFGEDDASVSAIEKEETKNTTSQEKIIRFAQLNVLFSLGYTLNDANTENGLFLPSLYIDESYQNKLKEFTKKLNRFNEGVENILLSISRIVHAGQGNVVKLEFADLSDGDTEFEFKLPLIGAFDYDYGSNGIDRCPYQYANDEYAYTGPFVVEKYIEYSQKILDQDLGFLSSDAKREIQVFFLEAAVTASLAHANNLYNLEFKNNGKQRDALQAEKEISSKLIEKLNGLSKSNITQNPLTTIYTGIKDADKDALQVPEKFIDLLDGLRRITSTEEFVRENAENLGQKTKLKRSSRTASAGPM